LDKDEEKQGVRKREREEGREREVSLLI